jgi:hypothetical protein
MPQASFRGASQRLLENGAFAGVEQAGAASVFHVAGLDGAGAWVVTYRSVSTLILKDPAIIFIERSAISERISVFNP